MIPVIESDSKLEVISIPGPTVDALRFNTRDGITANPKVRKALNTAIDKQAIIDVVFQGSGQVAKNPIPPTMWGYNDAIVDDPYDPEAAKAMLEAEGVSDLSMKFCASIACKSIGISSLLLTLIGWHFV